MKLLKKCTQRVPKINQSGFEESILGYLKKKLGLCLVSIQMFTMIYNIMHKISFIYQRSLRQLASLVIL